MDQRTQEFVFENGERTFTCAVAPLRRAVDESWWWFHVSTESGDQRHAPFRAAAGDTRADVQARVVAYYEHLLARRAEPARSRWDRTPVATAAPAAAAPAPAT